MASPIIAQGTGYVLFAYDVAHAFDLAGAETRLASATQRQTVKQKRRAPAFFEYDPAPLRVTEPADSLAVGEHVTAPYVEFVLYDFGAVTCSPTASESAGSVTRRGAGSYSKNAGARRFCLTVWRCVALAKRVSAPARSNACATS